MDPRVNPEMLRDICDAVVAEFLEKTGEIVTPTARVDEVLLVCPETDTGPNSELQPGDLIVPLTATSGEGVEFSVTAIVSPSGEVWLAHQADLAVPGG